MRAGKVFFHPIEGSGVLTISWFSGPKGDAIEARKGSGVGFFSSSGELLSVIFDEIQSAQDQQILEFHRYRVKVTVKNSKVTYTVTEITPTSLPRKKRVSRRQSL